MQLNSISIGPQLRMVKGGRDYIISLTCLLNGRFEFVNSFLLYQMGSNMLQRTGILKLLWLRSAAKICFQDCSFYAQKNRRYIASVLAIQQSCFHRQTNLKKNICLIVFSCLPVCMFHFRWGELFPYSWADLQEHIIPVIFFCSSYPNLPDQFLVFLKCCYAQCPPYFKGISD